MNPLCIMVAELSSRIPSEARTRSPVRALPRHPSQSAVNPGSTSNCVPGRYLLASYAAWASACSGSIEFLRKES